MKLTLLTLTAALAAATLTGSAQTSNTANIKDDLFVGTEKFAKGASDIEEITMDHDTLSKVGSQASGLVLNVVHTYSYARPGMYNIADVDEFRNKLNTGDWHCSVHISHPLKGESTDVCERRRTDNMRESAIITVEPRQLTFIHKITRERAGGNQSWNSYSGSGVYGGFGSDGFTYSSAQMHAEMQVAMAEMHANMAGMNAGLWSREYTVPSVNPQKFTGPSGEQMLREQTRRLSETLRNLPSADAGTVLQLQKEVDSHKQ